MKICETIFRRSVIVKQYLRQLNSLRESLKTADTKEKLAEIKKIYYELESTKSTKIAKHIAEIKKISEAMKALDLDYQDSIATLEEFKVIERKENGEIFYKGDYDGTKEKVGQGLNFTDTEFTMPTLVEIFARMTPEQILLYYEMKNEGLAPRLQLTPIAKTIRTLAKHIDGYEGYAEKNDYTYVNCEIKDEELIYEPESYDTNDEGKELFTIGVKTKSKWIEENNGWLTDIVATVQKLEADPEIKTDANNEEYTNAEKTVKYHKKNKPRGYRGMSYESYLIAQMRALRNGKPLDRDEDLTYTILTDSSTQYTLQFPNTGWGDKRIILGTISSIGTNRNLRYRRSVRIPNL